MCRVVVSTLDTSWLSSSRSWSATEGCQLSPAVGTRFPYSSRSNDSTRALIGSYTARSNSILQTSVGKREQMSERSIPGEFGHLRGRTRPGAEVGAAPHQLADRRRGAERGLQPAHTG